MRESSHALDGAGIGDSLGGNFEDPTVGLLQFKPFLVPGVLLIAILDGGLLATEPGPPRRRAAGAVPDRAAQARPGRFELGGPGIEDQVCAAALAELVICRAGLAKRDSRAIDFMIPAECDGVAV